VQPARAATISLFEWDYRTTGPTLSVNATAFDTTTGLGQLAFTVTGSGAFFVFFDHEIDESVDTFFNEYGSQHGVVPAGLSWEIDEPGYVFGDIHANFLAGTLDNSNGVPVGAPDDVSVALGWSYDVAAGELGLIRVNVGLVPPASGFYLQHTNPGAPAPVGAQGTPETNLYFTTSLTIRGDQIPEPATLLLVGTGLILLGGRVRRRR
jgi:hypothetical protein